MEVQEDEVQYSNIYQSGLSHEFYDMTLRFLPTMQL